MQSFWNCDMKRHYQENTTCCKILNSLGNPDMSNWDHTKEEKKKNATTKTNFVQSTYDKKKKSALDFYADFWGEKEIAWKSWGPTAKY